MPWLEPEQDLPSEPEPVPPALPRLLLLSEVAQWLRKSERTVHRLIAANEIPAVVFGGTRYVREQDILAVIDTQIAARLGSDHGRRGARRKVKISV